MNQIAESLDDVDFSEATMFPKRDAMCFFRDT